MAKYNYFISFHFVKGKHLGVGNSRHVSSKEITSMEQIMNIETDIAFERKFDLCIVMNFQLLSKED